ncbi:hypothetical protein HDU93_002887, partial [Gonapodya sp. JEL0774]
VIEEEEALPVIKYAVSVSSLRLALLRDSNIELRFFLKMQWDSGINFWDTANVYSNGVSETITGNALKKYSIPRDRVVIATKEVEGSLKRLGTDYIDLYQIHRYDSQTPIDETMRALDDLVRAGKVRYLGASSMYAWQFSKAQYTAKLNGWTPFVSMVGPTRGMLTGKNRNSVRQGTDPMIRRMAKTFEDQIVDRCIEVAGRIKATPSQVALAWVYSKPFVTSPIVGVSKTKYIDDLVGAIDLKLSGADIKYLEESYAPKPISGHI